MARNYSEWSSDALLRIAASHGRSRWADTARDPLENNLASLNEVMAELRKRECPLWGGPAIEGQP